MNHVSIKLTRCFYEEIPYLLRRDHRPRVKVLQSSITGAGEGVFSQQKVAAGTPLCLYPGTYTPGPPSTAIAGDDIIYLGNELPPSAVPPEENAYIMNLREVGGYIDGLALKSSNGSCSEDKNPSACAHKINHSQNANVVMIPFQWADVTTMVVCRKEYFPLPNSIRADHSPWFFDGRTNEVQTFEVTTENDYKHLLCGAAICSIRSLQPGEEILLDYGLKPPYPAWASGWYDKTL